MWFRTLPIALYTLLAAGEVYADAIDDVREGTLLRFTSVVVRYDGDIVHAGAYDIEKSAGTLDVVVPYSIVGVSDPGSLRLAGRRSATGLEWHFDQRISPSLRTGGVRVKRIQGSISARVAYLPGASSPACFGASCLASVVLTLHIGEDNEVKISGCKPWALGCKDFNRKVRVQSFRAFAGVPRSVLLSAHLTQPRDRCLEAGPVLLPGVVTLQSAAPSGGAYVELRSTDTEGVRVNSIRVPAGRRSARFNATLLPGWTGIAQVVASAGGATELNTVRRDPCILLKPPLRHTLLADWATYHGFINERSLLLHGESGYFVWNYETDSSRVLKALDGIGDASVTSLDVSGELVGVAAKGEAEHLFRWNIHQDDEPPELYAAVTPFAVNTHGLVVAQDKAEQSWVLLDEFGEIPLKKLSGYSFENILLTDSGTAVATIRDGEALYPAVVHSDGLVPLLQGMGRVIAANQRGEVAGYALDAAEQRWPYRWHEKRGLVWQPVPEGCKSATPVALNDSGWLLAQAECESGGVPYLIDDQGMIVWLDALDPKSEPSWEGVALGEDNAVLLRTVGGSDASVYSLLHH